MRGTGGDQANLDLPVGTEVAHLREFGGSGACLAVQVGTKSWPWGNRTYGSSEVGLSDIGVILML